MGELARPHAVLLVGREKLDRPSIKWGEVDLAINRALKEEKRRRKR
jgi:hypothetical protein